MAASGKTMNIRGVTFTPDSGQAVAITGVLGISVSGGGSIQKFSGDGDHFPTTVVNDYADPTVTVNFGHRPSALSLYQGMRGTFTWISKDARNPGSTLATGDTQFTVNKAIIPTIDFADNYRQFGTNSVSISTESSDGATSPLSFTVST